jgi:UDP-N-acetylmuramoyl-tripeptide--D-alanyl-D-alanine ligase
MSESKLGGKMTRPALLESARAVAEVLGGTLHGSGDRPIRHVTIDSRTCEQGSLFVALPGEHTDGHRFVADVLRSGAAGALVSHQYVARAAEKVQRLVSETGGAVCAVADPLWGLQELARQRLARFPHLTRVGITGSNGKTTTKELVASVLSRKASTFKTKGNFNSEIGVPLSVFEVEEDHIYGVFELAMNHVGEMEVLADIVRPDVALITNIGTAHIGLVGSRDGIAREKRQVFSRFDGSQTAVMYESEAYRGMLEDGLSGNVLLFGEETTPGYEGYEPLGVEGSLVRWNGREIRLPLAGEHNVRNALAAITIGLHFGCTDEEIHRGLEAMQPEFGRGEVIRGPVTVIQDSYNANADSMREAIRLLEQTPSLGGRKVLVLGAMYELGDYAAEHHREVLSAALHSDAELVFLFGEEFAAAAQQARAPDADRARDGQGVRGANERLWWTDDIDELGRLLSQTVRAGDLVLLKGSRGTRLERLLPVLTEGRE